MSLESSDAPRRCDDLDMMLLSRRREGLTPQVTWGLPIEETSVPLKTNHRGRRDAITTGHRENT